MLDDKGGSEREKDRERGRERAPAAAELPAPSALSPASLGRPLARESRDLKSPTTAGRRRTRERERERKWSFEFDVEY